MNPLFRLDHKTAIITGAARGLGRAVAELFAAQGAQLALVDRNTEEVADVAQQLGPNAHPYAADLSDVAAIPTLVQRIETDLGRIDILVNNAGICPRLSFAESTPDDW